MSSQEYKNYDVVIGTFSKVLTFVFWGIVLMFVLTFGTGSEGMFGSYNRFEFWWWLLGAIAGGLFGYVIASFITGISYVLLSIDQQLKMQSRNASNQSTTDASGEIKSGEF